MCFIKKKSDVPSKKTDVWTTCKSMHLQLANAPHIPSYLKRMLLPHTPPPTTRTHDPQKTATVKTNIKIHRFQMVMCSLFKTNTNVTWTHITPSNFNLKGWFSACISCIMNNKIELQRTLLHTITGLLDNKLGPQMSGSHFTFID